MNKRNQSMNLKMNSAFHTPISKPNDTFKVICSCSIFVSFITLFIVVYRLGVSSNELQESVASMQVQFLRINQQMTHMEEQLDSSSTQGLQYQVQEIKQSIISIIGNYELQTQTDSKVIQKVLVSMDELQKNVEGISLQLKTDSQSLNKQIIRVRLIKKEIEFIKKQSDEVILLSRYVSVLQSDSQKLQSDVQQFSPKIQDHNMNIDSIQKDLTNISSQLLNLQLVVAALPYNTSNNSSLESAITTIKQQIIDLKSQIPVGRIYNSIEKYGPFVPLYPINTLILEGSGFSYYPTTTSCLITTKGKALITLIATGLGICNNCQAQMAFLKNRESDLPDAGMNNRLNGSSFIWKDWLPINHSQQFLVDEGTHEFIFGISVTDIVQQRTASFGSLSFEATVFYYE